VLAPVSAADLQHLIAIYGYWVVAGIVALESMGVPVPGETTLIAAAVYAGTTHDVSIVLVITAAAAGAIIGDNIGFWLGREFGYRLLLRYGRHLGLDERRIKLGQYLFMRHGGKVVFWGRFVAVLRALAAFLAGANRMDWHRFLLANAAGGIAWATVYGLGAYYLGQQVHRLAGPVRVVATVIAVAAIGAMFLVLRRNEERWAAEAERALPGPLGPVRG
jgi:membrane protein DedA with SNARE-associated domain